MTTEKSYSDSKFEPSLAESKNLEDLSEAYGSPQSDEEKKQAGEAVEAIYSTQDSRKDNAKVYRGEIESVVTLEELGAVVKRLRSTEEQLEGGTDGVDNSEDQGLQKNSEFSLRIGLDPKLVDEKLKRLIEEQTRKIELWDNKKTELEIKIKEASSIRSLNIQASYIYRARKSGELDQTRLDNLKEVVEEKRIELWDIEEEKLKGKIGVASSIVSLNVVLRDIRVGKRSGELDQTRLDNLKEIVEEKRIEFWNKKEADLEGEIKMVSSIISLNNLSRVIRGKISTGELDQSRVDKLREVLGRKKDELKVSSVFD